MSGREAMSKRVAVGEPVPRGSAHESTLHNGACIEATGRAAAEHARAAGHAGAEHTRVTNGELTFEATFPSNKRARQAGEDTDMAATQAKAFNVEAGKADMSHNDNGKASTPYHKDGGLKRAMEGVPVRDTSIDGEERFYLLPASQEVDDLVKSLTFGKRSADPHKKRAIFASGSEAEGNYIPGTTSLCLRMGKYKEWLTGDAAPPKGLHKHTEWLEQGSRCGFQRPVRIKPEGDMTVEVLRRVAHQARGSLPDDVVDGILF